MPDEVVDGRVAAPGEARFQGGSDTVDEAGEELLGALYEWVDMVVPE